MGDFMSPSATTGRRHLHTRSVQFNGYLRDDGLWDIEAELQDTKTYPSPGYEHGELLPGQPVHHIFLRLAIDNDLVIREAAFDMKAIPFAHCGGAAANPETFVGLPLGRGWRRAVDDRMKGTLGCSHLRELLYGAATAAFQTVTSYRETHMPEIGAPKGPSGAPFYLNQCRSWAFDSPVVERLYPQFFQPGQSRMPDRD
jgi:hypothetical protein